MGGDSKPSGGSSISRSKIISGVFAAITAIVTPIVVNLGSNAIQRKLDASKNASRENEADSKKSQQESKDPTVSVKPTEDREVNPPTSNKKGEELRDLARREGEKKGIVSTVQLFNGKDLTNFYTYLGPPQSGRRPLGKNVDPDQVFSVQDGLLRISGKVSGALETILNYENYHLTVEYRFGEKKWPPRENLPKLSAVQIHDTGPDGAIAGYWMVGYRIFIDENGTGSITLFGSSEHKTSLVAEVGKQEYVEAKKKRTRLYYKPGAAPTPILEGNITRLGLKTPTFEIPGPEVKPKNDWNTLEVICSGDKLKVLMNGTVVNAATKLSQDRGKIAFRSEGAEIFFRKIELKSLSAEER
jgi:hypothetical protein